MTIVRATDHETSHAAAAAKIHSRAHDRAVVERLHMVSPAGLTDDELLALIEGGPAADVMSPSSSRTRRNELWTEGIILETVARRPTRPRTGGRAPKQAVVWIHRANVRCEHPLTKHWWDKRKKRWVEWCATCRLVTNVIIPAPADQPEEVNP